MRNGRDLQEEADVQMVQVMIDTSARGETGMTSLGSAGQGTRIRMIVDRRGIDLPLPGKYKCEAQWCIEAGLIR
jgi:hypothetical protein